jgi:hypothetical protein
MKSKLTISSALLLLVFINNIFSQDKNDPRWYFPPASSRVVAPGEYPQLPSTYSHPNSVTRVIKSKDGMSFDVPPNFRPFPDAANTQSEVTFYTQANNQNVMYGGWNSISLGGTFYSTGWARTTDGGTTWIGNHTAVQNYGDPGPWIWTTGSAFPNRLGMSYITPSFSIGAAYSTDGGTTWQPGVSFPGVSSNGDKNLSAVDDIPSSPFYGRAYTVYTDFGGGNTNRISMSYTTNGGVSWSAEAPVSPAPAGGHHCQGCDVVVGPGGVVYVCWGYCQTNGQNSTEVNLGFAKSLDGGVTWATSTNTAVPTNGIRNGSFINGCRANGFPRIAVDKSGGSRNGNVYCTMCEKNVAPARDGGDVTFMRSTDGGATWTHTLVNSDPPGNLQWHSCVTVDQTTGLVAVGYYDQRNVSSTQAQYYVSFSNNGGNSWTDVQAADHNWTVDYLHIGGVAAGYMGDYSGITCSNGKIYPFWNDPSINPGASLQQVWTCAINPVQLAHDYACGPFLGLPPSPLLINTNYNIKTRVTNNGSSGETSVPIKYFINGTLTNTTNLSLAAGGVDSVNNVFNTASPGTYQLMYVSALATDQDRTNDTVRATVNVVASLPPLCEQFEGGTFPPTGWSASGTWWKHGTVSGFGIGNGSAYYNMWSAPVGADEHLITPTFPPTQAGNMLHVDMAYSPYPTNPPYAQDSLIIQASTDGGATWISVARLGPLQMQTVPSSSSQFTPTANQWVKRNYPMPTGTNKIDFFGRSQFGNDVYIDSTCLDALVGISHNGNEVPRVYSLAQNYPNPFNPTTNISFGLPKAGLVRLVVYDLLGRVVSTLVNEHRQAGTYSVSFDAANLSSGVYFYKIESGDFTSIKKMVLVK